MSFGEALQALEDGQKVKRSAWNGKGLHIEMNYGFTIDGQGKEHDETRQIQPFFIIFTPPDRFNTWVPSISDILADDWSIA